MPHALTLVPIPAFNDNYIWLVHDGRHAVVVDPGSAEPVQQYLMQHGLTLEAMLLTHHHHDHIGGTAALQALWPQAVVVGHSLDAAVAPLATLRVNDGDDVRLTTPELALTVMAVPGHTLGHVAYYAAPWLFCGDTLFAAGCGRLFEGTPQQMHDALGRLAQLPGDTHVCCGHEYTVANLQFAAAVEPDNDAVARRLMACQTLRQQQRPTLPSTLAEEQATNPFLRCDDPALKAALGVAGDADSVAVFTTLRHQKDVFRTT